MKAREYEKMYAAERGFWWFAGKGLLVERWAGRYFEQGGDFLDVGCGTGANLERLGELGRWTGADLSDEALGFCARRGRARLVRCRASELPFADGSFHGATALDVLEHMEDDRAAAAELFRVLRPGGRLIVTVPAHPFLFGPHDLALGHLRRYHGDGLGKLLEKAGFALARRTHFMGSIFPAMAAGKFWQRLFGGSDDTMSYEWPGVLNSALLGVISAETRMLDRLSLPFGTTLAAAAEKPGAGRWTES